MITAMSAAQRLKLSVAEVEALWEAGELKGKKEFSQLYVEKESVYAYSGLKEGKQSKKGAGRKPNVMTFEATATYLNTDIAGVKKLVEGGVFEVVEGAGGVRGPKEAQVKMYKKELEKLDTFKGELGGSEVAEEETEEKSVNNENKDAKRKDNDTSAAMADDDTDESKASQPKEPSETRQTDTRATKGATTTEDETKSPKDESIIPPEGKSADESNGSGDKISLDKEMSLDNVMKELFPGIQRLDKQLRDKALGKCKKCEVKYNEHDMKEVADISYKMGKLAVYESLSEFKRSKPEKLVKRKAKV